MVVIARRIAKHVSASKVGQTHIVRFLMLASFANHPIRTAATTVGVTPPQDIAFVLMNIQESNVSSR